MTGEADPSFDDAITFFVLSSIGASENDNHVKLPHWLSFMKYALRKLNLYVEVDGLDEETKEERRRYVFIPKPRSSSGLIFLQIVVVRIHDR